MLGSIYVPTPILLHSLRKRPCGGLEQTRTEQQLQLPNLQAHSGPRSAVLDNTLHSLHFIGGGGGSDVPGIPSIMVQEADGRDQASRLTLRRRPRPHRTGVASLFNYSGVWSAGQPCSSRLKLLKRAYFPFLSPLLNGRCGWKSTSLSP